MDTTQYSAITNSIKVSVTPSFLADQSMPEKGVFVWAYNVEIENRGKSPVQLKRRHWQVIDSAGNIAEVDGEGVVGEQPIIKPKDRYHYSSGTFLNTPSGVMKGYYKILSLSTDAEFEIEIPMFSLDSPFDKNKPC